MKTSKPSDWSDFDWLWVELSRAVQDCKPGEDMFERFTTPPWESSDQAIVEAWQRITDPKNLQELLARNQTKMNHKAEFYSRKALEICLQRSKETR
jgi:hypothetical protein